MTMVERRIAVIGMACRLPGGADGPESLWSMLAEGRDGRKEVPKDRWEWRSFYNKNPDTKDATNFSHAYFLDDDVSAFDARFFNISGIDAATIDPQQRLLLEVTYEALENAGLPIEIIRGSDTSVHMAMFARDYDRMGYRDMAQADMAHIIGAGEAIMANRISYVLDLKGSSNTLDTGCSGGLVALHQACQTLRADESRVALAGASQLLLTPDQSVAMSQLTNKDGRSYTFDDRGAGYARGEGLGVLVLKRLDRAVQDGDHIHAVIVDSGAGHDGKTSGIFLPNGDAQEALVRSVYDRAGLDPRETLFVESHGTGTTAGDNAEVGSIARVFGREAGRTSDLPVGSIKTNIGHLEAASGIAGTIKAIMVLKKNQIPPQLNFINPKPTLRLEERGLKVPLELTPLTPEGHTGPRRVSVNSFGYGGANAHAILEAYDQSMPVNGHVNGDGLVNGGSQTNGNGHYVNVQDHEHTTQPKLIVLSANSESSLSRLVSNLRQWLRSDQGQSASFADVVYTLNTRRSKLLWRCSVAASNLNELEEALGNAKLRPVKSARDVALAFVFTGQGAQWFAMGRELLTDSESHEFASSIAICNQIMKDLGCEWDLVEELIKDEKSSRLGKARFAQPMTTAIQIALVDLLGTTYGIRPHAVYGHSSGEIAAAYAAGALTREAAMRVALMRGICSAEAKSLNSAPGGMLAVGEGEDAVKKRIKLLDSRIGKVAVACVNSPESTTISGDLAALHELQTALGAASVFNRQLKVDSAYHSHHMEVVAPSYLSSLEGLTHGTPRQDVAFYSSVTGVRKRSGFGPSYWVSNLVSQVKFSAASQLVAQHLADAYSNAANVLIEVGPHAALSGPLRQSLSESSFKLASGAAFKYDYVPCLVRKTSAVSSVLALAGKVFESGSPVQLDGGESRKSSGSSCRVVGDLPSYPWDHSNTYWRESRLSKKNRLRPFAPHDLLGIFEVNSSPYEPRWRYHVSLVNIPWLRDHVVEGFVIFPGAGYLIMVIEAMKQLFQLRKMPGIITNINFRDATFAKPLVILDDDSTKAKQEVELQLVISHSRQHAGSPWEHFRVVSYDSENDGWIDNCSGLVSWDSVSTDAGSNTAAADQFVGTQDDGLGHFTNETADRWLRDVQAHCTSSVDAKETYRHLKATGNEYGDTFQGLKEIHIGKGHATATIVIQDISQQIPGHYMQPHTIHPSTFDSIFQLEPVCFQREGLPAPIMPSMLGQISVAVDMESAPGTEILVALQHFQRTPRDAAFAYCAYQKRGDGSFRPVVTGTDIRTQVVGEADRDTAVQKKMTYRMEWNAHVDYLTQNHLAGHDTGHDHLFDTRIAAYLQAVVHKNPNMKILALGAGNGDIIVPLLEATRHNGRLPVDSYTCTEESPGLLERARNSLDRWADQIDFKTLDITSDPLPQGHAANNFDLAIASMAWIASPRVDAIMANLRKLLKPGGRLMLLTLTAASAARKEVSDILNNPRASEDEQQDASSMTLSDWNLYLERNGFSSTELALSAGNNLSSGASSMIVAKALTAAETANGHPQEINERSLTAKVHLGYSKDASQVVFGDALCRSLESQSIKCSRESWSTISTDAEDPMHDDISIVVDSAEYPVLLNPSAETFGHVKRLLLQGGNVLWVSFQTSPPFSNRAALKHMINGTARVLRRENPDLRLITVDIQDPIQRGSNGDNLQSVIQMVTDVTKRSFWSPSGVKYEDFRPEHEHAIRNGMLMIPRVIPDDDLATHIDSRSNAEQNKTADAPLMNCLYLDKDRPIKFDVQVPGLLKTVRFIDNDDMSGPLNPDEVQIEAHAHGVSFKDVSITLGHMAPGTPMSGEVAGVIVAVGSNVQSCKVGDRVTALSVAQFGNQVRVHNKNAVSIPDSLTFADAASIPLAYLTAWYCLHQVARIEKGQSVLIHSGSGGVGQSAIQLAQLAGAEIFVTAGSIGKKRLIEEQYGIPASQIFSSHSGKFKKQILDATRGNGVDVVLNSLPGQLLRDSWDCLAPFGTFCEIGKTDILGRGQLSMAKFDKQATFAAVDALYMQLVRPERAVHGIERIFSMVDEGLLKPVHPITTFDMSHIEQAFSLMAERKHMGKLVLVADEQTRVQATKPKAHILRLRQDGTYVIGGGLGDLGKRMGQFLAGKGAGHIVALTRRDVEAVAKQPAIMEVRESIKKLGGTLHVVQCDICDSGSARGAADMLALLGLPPVRGIIQSATVLRDHPLEFMELNDWQESVRPKVHGTLTLDEAFCSPETTEFFVMLSSVASIVGSASQSNYAAGNAFLDAFAQSRKHSPRGITKYATINVGAVEGSELVAGALQQGSDVTRSIGSVSFNDVLAALEYAMNPEARVRKDVVQHLMHFDRDTMEDSFGPSALSDRLYDHVPSKRRREANASATDGKKQSILQTVEQVETIAEAEDIVKQALLGKFTAFIGDEVPDVPIAALGLDSLVSIELKNWVKHTFRTPLQISELSGAQSMIALAKVIVSRMTLKLNNVNGTGPDDDDDDQVKLTSAPTEGETDSHPTSTATADKTEDATSKPTGHDQNCCKLHRDLPVQPLPDLDDTLDYWLEANEHLFRSQQLESIHHDIQAMRAPDSTARQILRRLYDSHGHDETNGWFADIVTDARFLCRRSPIAPWTSIMGAQRDNSGKRHSQVERASIITSAALSYRRAMDAGEVEPLEIAGRPECTWGWKWLFNSTRIPQLECDKMVSYAHFSEDGKIQDHVAVLRKGRVFKVAVQDDQGQDVPFQQLQATFEAIVAREETDTNIFPGFLTTDDRDSWAKIRKTLVELSPKNAEYFQVLDSAMFVLCLDAGHPESPDEIARQGYIGDGANRWFDKVLQFYVSANGRSGLITEHGILDGTTATRLLEWIAMAMESYSAGSTSRNGHTSGDHISSEIKKLNEVTLEMTPEIEGHALTLGKIYQQATSASTYVREQLDEFGTAFLLQSRVPVKGVIDLTFQLAVRLFFGQNMTSWEPTSGALFHAGRADALQRATPAVNAFCNAAVTVYHDQSNQEDSGTSAELRALLLAATKSTNAGMQTLLLTGRGSQRVFEVLSYLWPKSNMDAPKPAFLSDMVFFGRPSPPIFAQTNSLEGEMIVEDFVHLMQDTDGFWSFICPENNTISVSLTGGSPERTAAFVKELHRAARIIRDIVGRT